MRDDQTGNCPTWEYAEGWQKGRDRLSSVFLTALLMSYGLTSEELDKLSEQYSLLAYCLQIIAAEERDCCEE